MKTKHPGKIMFWGGISIDFKTDLICIDGNMNSQKYIDMLKKSVIPKLPQKTKKFNISTRQCKLSHITYV